MATVKNQQLIFDLNVVEAKIAEKTLPAISPILEMIVKFYLRYLLQMALMGGEKWRELYRRLEQGEDLETLSQEAMGGPEAFRGVCESLTKDLKFPSPEEIEQMFD